MKDKKRIHDLLSPRIVDKRMARRKAALLATKNNNGPVPPPSVNNFKTNKPLFGPHKIKKKPVEVKPRVISKEEGKATVNAKTNTKRFIHKSIPKVTEMDPATGAIDKVPDKRSVNRSSRAGRKKKSNVDK